MDEILIPTQVTARRGDGYAIVLDVSALPDEDRLGAVHAFIDTHRDDCHFHFAYEAVTVERFADPTTAPRFAGF